ncbi:MAG: acyltransferase [Chloroflexi bacterium]|nr:acyltransferase [Chloroflexota bacterium]
MAAHFGLGFPQGGRIGVTVFFALSGYLITALLLAERRESGHIDLRAFWIRRGRRLLPALFVLIAVFLAYHLLRGGFRQAVPAALVTAFYLANYADNLGVNLGLLSHTWSLAVEEQFYLWWPLALIALLAWRPRFASVIVVLAAFGVAAVNMFSIVTGASFFFPISRGDALLGGAALAILGVGGVRWTLPLGLGGVILVSLLPGNPAWIYVVAAALGVLVVAGAEGSILAWPPLVFVGKISYSLYLWHQPAERMLAAFLPKFPLPVMIAIDTGVSLALALASYHVIESRFRRRSSPGERPLPILPLEPSTTGAIVARPVAEPDVRRT